MSGDCDSRLGRRKSLASFYTPRVVARALTDWAIADTDTTVLDPSFGGCAFLYAAVDTLHNRGNAAPGSLIFGVDIDPGARSYLGPLFASGATRGNFLTADFFEVGSDQFPPGSFGAVVGNPPFIRHHDIPDSARDRAMGRLRDFGIEVSGRASYWALFLLYAIQFVHPGGRLAMVLPTAFMNADYSVEVRKFLASEFERVAICLLDERIFDGTDERVALVCASGAKQPHRSLRIGIAATVRDLTCTLEELEGGGRTLDGVGGRDWLLSLIDPDARIIFEQVQQKQSIVRLGEWVKAGIGVVTGNNDYFLLSGNERRKAGIPESCVVPIARRPAYLKGLWVTDEDMNATIPEGQKSLLLKVSQTERDLPVAVREYIRYGRESGVAQAHKCRERHPWYGVRSVSVPQAFVPCMSATWPRLVLNRSQFTCTNNILRLFWKAERPPEDWLRLALGTLSTISQLSAELVGRSYGGGVLKVEPSELARLTVPLVPRAGVTDLAREVDLLLRRGQTQAATHRVDDAVCAHVSGLSRAAMERLRTTRDWLFARRRGRD